MRALGIILAGGNNNRMRELSNRRAIAAMPVAGSYRSIDFALSNMTNSHIAKVAVLTQYNARSLNEHLSSSKWWNFGRKQGGLFVFTPTITPDNSFWYQGTADAIYQNLDFLKRSHDELLMTTTHHYLMFFTNMGKVYRLKAYEIPEAGRTARGTAIINLLQLQAGEKITAVLSLKDYSQGQYLFMATKSGIVKKTPIQDYANVRKTGLAAISLKDDDELIEVKFTDNKKDIILVTKYGQCIRFKDTDVRSTGRVSMGVRGINLSDGDEIIGMQLCSQGDYLLIVSEKGMGKRTSMSEFSVQNRGGKGVKCYKITEKTGNVVGVKAVNDDNEVMMITTEGIIIRIACSDISILGRITSGVKLMNLDEKVSVASIAKVREKEENTEVNEQEDTESEE